MVDGWEVSQMEYESLFREVETSCESAFFVVGQVVE